MCCCSTLWLYFPWTVDGKCSWRSVALAPYRCRWNRGNEPDCRRQRCSPRRRRTDPLFPQLTLRPMAQNSRGGPCIVMHGMGSSTGQHRSVWLACDCERCVVAIRLQAQSLSRATHLYLYNTKPEPSGRVADCLAMRGEHGLLLLGCLPKPCLHLCIQPCLQRVPNGNEVSERVNWFALLGDQ